MRTAVGLILGFFATIVVLLALVGSGVIVEGIWIVLGLMFGPFIFAGIFTGSTGVKGDKKKLDAAVDTHYPALARNFWEAVVVDEYGTVVQDNRKAVVAYFLQSQKIKLQGMTKGAATKYIQEALDAKKAANTRSGFNPDLLPIDGFEFEAWVADGLRQFGWDAYATQGSGDQGIDVIAKRDGVSIALQCKLYSKPVGNKAVQEALAGAQYAGMDFAAVITNAGYTRSATELAAATNVILLSQYDIPKLHERFSSTVPSPQ